MLDLSHLNISTPDLSQLFNKKQVRGQDRTRLRTLFNVHNPRCWSFRDWLKAQKILLEQGVAAFSRLCSPSLHPLLLILLLLQAPQSVVSAPSLPEPSPRCSPLAAWSASARTGHKHCSLFVLFVKIYLLTCWVTSVLVWAWRSAWPWQGKARRLDQSQK